MRMRYFGDSFDFVKQAFLHSLGDLGSWSTLPMFTERPTRGELSSLAAFLGTGLVSTNVLTRGVNRASYFQIASKCDHLFIDPNTGVRLTEKGCRRPREYVFASELVSLARQRPSHLTMVFDQSLGFGRKEIESAKKLRYFAAHGISGFAYVSHACFIIVGQKRSLVDRARRTLIKKCRLPECRLLPVCGSEKRFKSGRRSLSVRQR